MVIECTIGFFIATCPVPDITPDAARFCQTAEPFYYSAKDTPKSREQARKHNAKGVTLCGWGKK